MSVFIDMLVEMLPMASSLQNKNNKFRKVLDYTIGAYMEDKEPVFDELFLSSATGGWLDAFGRDYGVSRRVDEDDDSYRNRIIFEKLEYLTSDNLKNIFGVELYNAYDGFNPSDNDLTSDNPYMSNFYIGVVDEDTQNILNKKFLIDDSIVWYNGGELDYVITYPDNVKVLKYNLSIYGFTDINQYRFKRSDDNEYPVVSAKLTLPNVINCIRLFYDISKLTSVDLNLPNATNCSRLLWGCTSLENVDLNLPKASDCHSLLQGCTSLTSIDLDLPKAIICDRLLRDCTSLENVDLNLPKASDCHSLLQGCTSLENVTLNMPNLSTYFDIFKNCSNIETIDVTIPNDIVNDFKSYVLGLELSNLTSFIINGEEVDLS